MSRKKGAIVLLLVMMILGIGCSPQTRYEVLTFFFTGVPSPADEARLKAQQDQGEDKNAPGKTVFSSHSYFAAKKCDACHQMTSAKKSKKAGGSSMSSLNFGTGKAGGGGGLPIKKICVNCHEDRSAAFASANRLWLHAPATKGNCLVCHTPHRSKYPNLLTDETEKLCTLCHSEGLIRLTEIHQEAKDCLECHNPHLGKDKLLLIKDYKEVRKLPDEAVSYDGQKKVN